MLCTRPYLAYTISQTSQFSTDPSTVHETAAKRSQRNAQFRDYFSLLQVAALFGDQRNKHLRWYLARNRSTWLSFLRRKNPSGFSGFSPCLGTRQSTATSSTATIKGLSQLQTIQSTTHESVKILHLLRVHLGHPQKDCRLRLATIYNSFIVNHPESPPSR